MYTTVLEGMQVAALYQRLPGILLGLMLLMPGCTLLAIGLGWVQEVRSSFCVFLGAAALGGAILAPQASPTVAYHVVYAVAGVFALLGPMVMLLGVLRLNRAVA